MCNKDPSEGFHFSAPPLGLMKIRPTSTLHILHIHMCLMTQNDTYMTQNESVMIHGMIMTMNMLFSYSYYIHYSNDTVNVLFYLFLFFLISLCVSLYKQSYNIICGMIMPTKVPFFMTEMDPLFLGLHFISEISE